MIPVLERLRALVAIDSTNPPRRSEAIAAHVEALLAPAFSVQRTDLGDGCIAVLATRGAPRALFNVHLDTVPVVPGWTRDPFALTVEGERAYGLGACDAKGAAAALIAAAFASTDPVAMLFTTDEEAGSARCARWFASEPRGFDAVIVGEPTENRAVVAHRGVGAARVSFAGSGGHASAGDAASANHALVAWAARAIEHAARRARAGFDMRLNVGRIEGGEKPNVVARTAEARFGVRPPPGASPHDVIGALFDLLPEGARGEITFAGEPLPSRMHHGEGAQALARAWGVSLGEPVDFWTEAAIFGAAVPALVYGPGSIRQAHTADEFVAVAALERAVADYTRAFRALARGLS